MSRKKGEISLIVPGRKFWEIWSVSGEGPAECTLVSEVTSVHELAPLPASELSLFFPLHQLTFAPFTVETTDSSLFGDLMESHWEQEGIRIDQDGGVLKDYAEAVKSDDSTLLAPYVLSAQQERDLPKRPAAHFDISPRAFHVEGNVLVFREELGQWTMSLYINETILFALIIGNSLDEESIRDAHLTLMQLEMQGTCPPLYRVELWDEKEVPEITKILKKPVQLKKMPLPTVPPTWSKLLPADVGAERRRKEERKRIRIVVIVAALLYVGVAAYLYKNILTIQKEVTALKAENATLEEPFKLLEELKTKWDSMEGVIDSSFWPDDILWRCYNARPDENSIRFTSFDVKTNELTGKPDSITIKGTSPSSEFVTKFGQRLKSPQFKLDRYDWKLSTPVPPTSKDNNLWTFSFEATEPSVNTETAQ